MLFEKQATLNRVPGETKATVDLLYSQKGLIHGTYQC
jgi:hypothetical protein